MSNVPYSGSLPAKQIVSAVTCTTTYQASDIIGVKGYRSATLLIDFDAGTIGDVLAILPLGSGSQSQPASAIVDEWYVAGVTDGSVTAAVPTETALSGADFTLSPEYGEVTVYPTKIKLPAADATTDEYRVAIQVDVSWMSWFHIQFANTANASSGVLNVSVVLRA